MRKIVVYENDEPIESIEFSGGYNISVSNLNDGGYLKHIRRLDNGAYDYKHWIKNYQYRPIARKLIEKFEEIEHIRSEEILFIEDTDWKPKESDKRPWQARISKANKQLAAMTGYGYVLETRRYFIETMSKEQIIALIYHELRHIDKEGDIIKHDVEEWINLLATLGTGWNSRKTKIIDILELEEWEKLPGSEMQIGLFGDRTLRVVR